jgi:glycosyltransferase involved in cell wall biosynthesis
MRVLHVIPSIAPDQGGPSFVLRQMVAGLSSAGVDVEVATTIPERPAAESMAIDSRVIVRCFPRQSSFYKFSWPLWRWLHKNVTQYDLVHIHALFSFPSIAAAYWAGRCRVPYLVRPLGTLSRWGFENRRPWLKNLSFRCIEERMLLHAAAVHYTTLEEQIEAERLSIRHRPVVIPNPCELAPDLRNGNSFLTRFPELAGKTVILFLSRIHPKKGLELLLPAFAEVRKSHPDAVLVIAGDGDAALVAKLQLQSDSLRITDAVFWAGFLGGAEKLDALKSAAVFVLPSYSENFGVAVIEAMAAGVPVAISDQVAVHREVTHAGAGFVCSCTPQSIAATLCRLLEDPAAAMRMGANGAAFARERYSISSVTKELVEVYGRILGCRPQTEAVVV